MISVLDLSLFGMRIVDGVGSYRISNIYIVPVTSNIHSNWNTWTSHTWVITP